MSVRVCVLCACLSVWFKEKKERVIHKWKTLRVFNFCLIRWLKYLLKRQTSIRASKRIIVKDSAIKIAYQKTFLRNRIQFFKAEKYYLFWHLTILRLIGENKLPYTDTACYNFSLNYRPYSAHVENFYLPTVSIRQKFATLIKRFSDKFTSTNLSARVVFSSSNRINQSGLLWND